MLNHYNCLECGNEITLTLFTKEQLESELERRKQQERIKAEEERKATIRCPLCRGMAILNNSCVNYPCNMCSGTGVITGERVS